MVRLVFKLEKILILISLSSMSCPRRILPVKYLSLWSIKSVNCNRSTINTKYILSHSQTNTTKYVNYTSQLLVAESFTQISCSRQPEDIFWVSKMLYVTFCTTGLLQRIWDKVYFLCCCLTGLSGKKFSIANRSGLTTKSIWTVKIYVRYIFLWPRDFQHM